MAIREVIEFWKSCPIKNICDSFKQVFSNIISGKIKDTQLIRDRYYFVLDANQHGGFDCKTIYDLIRGNKISVPLGYENKRSGINLKTYIAQKVSASIKRIK